MIIRVENNLTSSANKSYLSNPENAGTSTIRVKNINSFSSNWAVQMGETGEETAEIKLISSGAISGTSLTLTANTTYAHPTDTPVYAIKYDQVVFLKSSSGTAGTATVITNGTVNITPDSLTTEFDDSSGVSTDAYRARFKNSVTGETTSLSDWLTTSGFSFYSKAKIRERVKSKLFSAGYLKSDDSQIDNWLNEWLEEMTVAAIKVDESYSLGTVNVAFGTDGLGTITSTDFDEIKRIWITYNGTDKFVSQRVNISNIGPNDVYNSAAPIHAWRGDTVFQVLPSDTAGTAELIYYKRNTNLVNDADELPMPMRSFTNSFVNYCVSEAYYNDKKSDMGDRYLSRANEGKGMFIQSITPREHTGVNMIDMDYVVNGETDSYYQYGGPELI